MSAAATQQTGLVLFAHGARDERWAEPFRAVRAAVQRARPELPLALAFLELMQPDLASAVRTLHDSGCKDIRVIPLFLGEGAHLRRDLPALIEAQRTLYPDLSISVSKAAGEAPDVLVALAQYCLSEINTPALPASK